MSNKEQFNQRARRRTSASRRGSRMPSLWGTPARRRWCVLAAALVAVLAVVGIWARVAFHAQAASNSVPGDQLVRFSDTTHTTSFAMQLDATNPNIGVFTFETPTGVQYHGGQASDIQQHGVRIFTVHYDGPAQLIGPAADGQEASLASVTVHLNATIDLNQPHATAEIQDTTNSEHYVMVSQVPGGTQAAVRTYDRALINQDWATVYTLTSELTLGGRTEAEFAQAMAQQVQSVGTITATTVITPPQVTVDTTTGLTTFTVTEQMTITQGGVAQNQTITSVYILAGGSWKFLSSQ